MEQDWKHFRAQVPVWRERYLAARNVEMARKLTDDTRTPTECFWEMEEQMRQDARTLHDCLDGHSRNRMQEYLRRMLEHRMISAADLEGFSAEVREACLRC